MKSALIWVATASASLAGAGLHAQVPGDPVRMDEFALTAADPSSEVEQVTKGPVAPPPEQPRDRVIARPARAEPAGTAAAQLSNPGAGNDVSQLTSRAQSRAASPGPVGNPKDKLPAGVQRIGGQDRCDPQADRKSYTECARILERRADEFNAPTPPVLSPEQRLLGVVQSPDEALVGPSGSSRLRYAARSQPDAELRADQELASIYLMVPADAAAPGPASETETPTGLAEVLQVLKIDIAPPPPGGNQ
jgi:hypothetical protein